MDGTEKSEPPPIDRRVARIQQVNQALPVVRPAS